MEKLLLWIILGFPFASFATILLFLFNDSRRAPILSVWCIGSAAVATLVLLLTHLGGGTLEFSSTWLVLGDRAIVMGFLLDPLSLVMLAIVGVVSFAAQFYSLGYMKGDPGIARYYAWMSLFSWSMLFFVVSSNVIQAFIFWELVGLCSYLLIGFWYEKPAAASAAKKAFYLTRLGDIGFLVGVLLLLKFAGNLSFTELVGSRFADEFGKGMLLLISVLIFCGVMGKSAQFPLHSWLPDAMEGPTPVSALIHSATMVAAGVYLLARAYPFFSGSPEMLHYILFIGTLTALMSATMGLLERDIKRILAYSTVSQLGMMVMALGAGSSAAGMAHLLTHAFFKAMLFFTAGVFIHALGSNDLFELAAKGARRQKIGWWGLIVGCLALSGIFPFSGFFSKEAIYGTLLHSAHPNYFYAALLISFFTAAYSFRMIFVLGLAPVGARHAVPLQDEHIGDAHSEIKAMSWSIWGLMALTAGLGFAVPAVEKFIAGGAEHAETLPTNLALTLFGVVALGILVSFWDFGRKSKRTATEGTFNRFPILTPVIENKYFVDAFLFFLFRTLYLGIASFLHWFDVTFVNGAVNLTGRSVINAGRWATRLQSGVLQVYFGVGFISIAIMILVYLL